MTRNSAWHSLAAFGIVAFLAPTALAQPSPRAYMPMVYDIESQRFVLYGGQLGDFRVPANIDGETWVLDPATGEWEQRVTDPSPPPIVDANAAYDTTRDVVWLWGGGNSDLSPNQQVWSYDANTNTWTFHETATENSPPAPIGSRMVYDAASDVLVVFGGLDQATGSYLNETWLMDPEDESWTKIEAENAPRARNFFGFAYDPATDRSYVWGGGAPLYANVWAFDAHSQTWTEREFHPDAPYPKSYLNVVTLGDRGVLLVYGGPEGTDTGLTWTYDPSAHDWEVVAEEGPGMRSRFAMAHAPGFGTFLFGGQPGPEEFAYANDTWKLDVETFTWSQP